MGPVRHGQWIVTAECIPPCMPIALRVANVGGQRVTVKGILSGELVWNLGHT